MTVPFTIRYAVEDDKKPIQSIERALSDPCPVDDLYSSAYLKGKVAEIEGVGVVGYVFWSNECPWDREIVRLAVSPMHRRKGIATNLIAEIYTGQPLIQGVSMDCPIHCPDLSRTMLSNKFEIFSKPIIRGIQHIRVVRWV